MRTKGLGADNGHARLLLLCCMHIFDRPDDQQSREISSFSLSLSTQPSTNSIDCLLSSPITFYPNARLISSPQLPAITIGLYPQLRPLENPEAGVIYYMAALVSHDPQRTGSHQLIFVGCYM